MKIHLPVKAKCVGKDGAKWESPVTLHPGNNGELVVSWSGCMGWYVSSFCALDGYGPDGNHDSIAIDCGADSWCENRLEITRHIATTLAKLAGKGAA